ncbi:MAG: hypothetical protein JWR10_3176, partial [Rubritepida sp.]|nr:hypothetical protein [Rubritepida sp.]
MLASMSFGLAASSRAHATESGLASAGWTHGEYEGVHPPQFTSLPDGIAIEGQGTGSFVWRRVPCTAACLSWRWRVDTGPPATDLTRRGGDDRAVSLTVGFQGWPTHVSVWQRTQHALPCSLLIYVWGGTGHEAPLF